MSDKFTTNKELTIEDFVNKDGYEHNGFKLESVAEFYNVSDQERHALFALKVGFYEISQKMMKKQVSVTEYLQEIEKLNELTKSMPNINIGMNVKNEFVITIKSDLQYQYQNSIQEKIATKPPVTIKKPTILALYAIEWEESERGWGTRPDGFSFHRSPEEATQYLNEFYARQPKEVPDEYSRPINKVAKLIEVSESLHDFVIENGAVWLVPTHPDAYKTYDATHLNRPKNKM